MTKGSDDLQDQFFHLANQYYATGKFAMSAMLDPVCGTLYHHAVEFYLKKTLCLRMDKRRRKKVSHRLDALWSEFKTLREDPELD